MTDRPSPSAIAKAALRQELRARRRAFHATMTAEMRAASEAAIAENLRPLIAAGATFACYWAYGAEPDLRPFLALAGAAGARIALPRIDDRNAHTMSFRLWHPADPVDVMTAHAPQPIAAAPVVKPDIMLIPLLGFDTDMRRIGQGGGYYDRVIARLPDVRRIGIAWSCQQCAEVPVDDWDQPLHAVVTERDIFGHYPP